MSLFGTDGIRGTFGQPPLDRDTVGRIAAQLAATLGGAATGGETSGREPHRPLVVLGGDTRESTPVLCGWLASALRAGGVEVRYAGVVPTPGVAFLVRRLGAAAGVVVSASHNPYPDNGIKLFGPDGFKWSDEAEEGFERRLAATPVPPQGEPPPLSAEPELRDAYLDFLAAQAGAVEGSTPLAGLRVVLDAGNGAASTYAAEIFQRLGAETFLLSAWPDGRNVNEGCGSTAPGVMAARVVAEKADLGAAFDGDADRCILADERGEVRDGDAILYLWATALHRQGRLPGGRIVATSMSNLGLERALEREGVGIVRCDVGDRWVVEALRREGLDLGGEQSGHIVSLSRGTTGDGLLTALAVAGLRAQAGRPLSELLRPFRRYPQILVNVRVSRREDLAALPAVAAARQEVETALGRDGRLVLRYSGTEPLARVMIEGPEQAEIERLAALLAEAIRSEIGAAAGAPAGAHA